MGAGGLREPRRKGARVAAPSGCIVPWAARASCWPQPQQLLPVSAAGSGRRCCCSNPPLRSFYTADKTETPVPGSDTGVLGGRGWIARAAHLKKPRRGFFTRRTVRRVDAVRIHPLYESSLVTKQKPQRICIRWGFLVERSNPNPNHCPLGHLWRQSHRK